MLIIAQPKTASTSLAYTLQYIGALQIKAFINRTNKDKKCKNFEVIQSVHSNICVRSELFLSQVIKGRKTIFREHILPTREHLQKLAKFNENYIVLVRNPEHSLDNYKRLKISEKNLKKIDKELKVFHSRYLRFAKSRKNVLVIDYDDLILNYKETMKIILKHFNIKGPIIPLMKKKYTGIGDRRLLNDR
jgi:hypothetical protein